MPNHCNAGLYGFKLIKLNGSNYLLKCECALSSNYFSMAMVVHLVKNKLRKRVRSYAEMALDSEIYLAEHVSKQCSEG